MRRRSSWFRALPAGLLLFSAAVLLVCSGTSPLYRGHDWTDANTYLTMGRSLLQGVVPYRDLFDHKGPLLYGIYALGALLHPQGFYGIFLLQVLSLAATLYALYQAARSPRPLFCVCAPFPSFCCPPGYTIFRNAWIMGAAARKSSVSPSLPPPCTSPPTVTQRAAGLSGH